MSTSSRKLGNIEKCLRANYDQIVIRCLENRSLEKIKILAMERFDQDEREKLLFIKPDELYACLQTWSDSLENEEEKLKGYKVKVNYQLLEEDEHLTKREAAAQVILQSLKRQKEK